MTIQSTLLIGAATAAFIMAASVAKIYTLNPRLAWLAATLLLYTAGNLIMLRLIGSLGMSVALSLSAVVQLVAVNLVAVAVFGEKLSWTQLAGVTTAVLSVGIFALDSYLESR